MHDINAMHALHTFNYNGKDKEMIILKNTKRNDLLSFHS